MHDFECKCKCPCKFLVFRSFTVKEILKLYKRFLYFTRVSRCGKLQSLSLVHAFEIYQIRWGIEVLFKECKQYLELQSCQSRDFDAQIADMTLTFITHIILSLEYKFTHYETFGGLFHDMQKNLLEANIWEQILQKIESIICFLLEMSGLKMECDFDEVTRNLIKSPSDNDRFEVLYNALCCDVNA